MRKISQHVTIHREFAYVLESVFPLQTAFYSILAVIVQEPQSILIKRLRVTVAVQE